MTATLDTGAVFLRKERESTAWLSVTYPEGTPPTSLIDDLRACGWQTAGDRGRREVPPLDGIAEVTLSRPGSDLFGGWTSAEKTTFLRQARGVLKRHGYAKVALDTLPWQEFL